jgi:hypothetical protein
MIPMLVLLYLKLRAHVGGNNGSLVCAVGKHIPTLQTYTYNHVQCLRGVSMMAL